MPELQNLSVSFISLVESPANRRDIIWKGSGDKLPYDFRKSIAIAKHSPEGLVRGTVYAPNVSDKDGDWASAETIRKAAHDFMLGGRNFNVDENHSTNPIGAAVVETHLDEAGAWNVVIKMDPKSDTFVRIVKGEITGLSMFGLAKRVDGTPKVPQGDERIGKMQEQIDTLVKSVTELTGVVKGMPKSRQLVIDGDRASLGDSAGDKPFHEFDFGRMN